MSFVGIGVPASRKEAKTSPYTVAVSRSTCNTETFDKSRNCSIEIRSVSGGETGEQFTENHGV